MGQELLCEDIQISSSSQIEEGRKVDQNASHRADKPKRRSESRWRSSWSNHFESRLKRAQKEKEKIMVAEIKKDTNTSMEMVIATVNGKHEVIISTRPTCTCQDFIKNEKDLCKRIIWVCMYIMEVPVASPSLQQITHDKDTIKNWLGTRPPVPENLKFSPGGQNKNSKYQKVKEILSKDPRLKEKRSWCLIIKDKKPRKKPSCKNNNCMKEFSAGDLCITVSELYVPYNKNFAVGGPYYFCPKKTCLKTIPPWCNLEFLEKVKIEKGICETDISLILEENLPLIFEHLVTEVHEATAT